MRALLFLLDPAIYLSIMVDEVGLFLPLLLNLVIGGVQLETVGGGGGDGLGEKGYFRSPIALRPVILAQRLLPVAVDLALSPSSVNQSPGFSVVIKLVLDATWFPGLGIEPEALQIAQDLGRTRTTATTTTT